MENGWINGPVYAVEINIDSDTCDEPQLIVAKIDFGDLSDWSKGCSPANHGLFYNLQLTRYALWADIRLQKSIPP